jgi:prepilin-type N-terminal cleavage/methylation domain-containing protein/prepilin-type processing-associated H-X9-DG protein
MTSPKDASARPSRDGGRRRPGEGTRPAQTRFTLIELLVVIAIIGTLVSMLLPALSQAREAGKSIGCVNNLRQVALAFENYRTDWDDFMPTPYQAPTGPPDGLWDVCCNASSASPRVWADVLVEFQYMPTSLVDCPSVTRNGYACPGYWTPTENALEFAMNLYLSDNNGNIHGAHGRTFAGALYVPWPGKWITRPADGFLLTDSNAPSWTPAYRAPWMGDNYETPTSGHIGGRFRHKNGRCLNFLFFDGHGETVDCYSRRVFDDPPFGSYNVYSNGGNPTPFWRPWAPYFR